MKKKFIPILLGLLTPSLASAAVILETDFSGTTPSGTTLSGITWTTLGISTPANSLTVTNNGGGGNNAGGESGNLHTTTDAVGYFAPDNNTGSGGEWITQIDFTTLAVDVTLDSFDIDWSNFNNSGSIPSSANAALVRDNVFQVQIIDLDNGNNVLFDATQTTPAVNSFFAGVQTETFNLSAVSLDASTNYRLSIAALDAPIAGSQTGVDAITLNGTLVPEPSSALLLGLGSLALVGRRKRA